MYEAYKIFLFLNTLNIFRSKIRSEIKNSFIHIASSTKFYKIYKLHVSTHPNDS